ncbi:MAG: hypothetical protein J0L57_05815 [Burkholderiales bacterium]|nr:hypothetical protein [Burkholderiales bacterium]
MTPGTEAPPPAMRRPRSGWRRPVHALIVGGGWVGFGWMWWLVGAQPWDVRPLVWLIAGSIVVLPLATAAWVRHNRRIFRRKGERRSIADADLGYPRDWHGRTVSADWAALATARHVLVTVDGTTKRYLDASPRPARPHPAPAPSVAPPLPDFADTAT